MSMCSLKQSVLCNVLPRDLSLLWITQALMSCGHEAEHESWVKNVTNVSAVDIRNWYVMLNWEKKVVQEDAGIVLSGQAGDICPNAERGRGVYGSVALFRLYIQIVSGSSYSSHLG